MRPARYASYQLGAAFVLMFLGSSMGCATQGDLATVQHDLRNGLASVRGQEQSLAELRRDLKNLEQGKYKELHDAEMRLTQTVREVQQQLEVLMLSQSRVKEALQQMEASGLTNERIKELYREKARLEGILHAMHITLVEGLKTEKAELKDRLQVLDEALNGLQQSADETQTQRSTVPEDQRRR
jgi:signal transduction histidine kinase